MEERKSSTRPRRLTRLLLGLIYFAGMGSLVLLADGERRLASARGGGDPMAGYFSAGMPRYPGAEEIPAGGASRVGQARLKMAFFATEDDPDKVARHYAAAWRARRFFVREDVTHRGGFVSAIDAASGLVYQVLLQISPGSDGRSRTLVFPSETALPGRAADVQTPPPLPLLVNSRVLLTLQSREGGHRSLMHLSVNEGGLEENLAHLQREAQAAGWQREKGATASGAAAAFGPGHHMLIFRKPERELTIDLSVAAGKQVRVHQLEMGR
jgi:hypothetical protein